MNGSSRKNEVRAGGIPGVATLIMVFAVLCIAVFSVLALSTARSNKKLSDVSLDNVKLYYAADTAAQEKVAELRREGAAGTYDFSVPVSDTRELFVTVEIGNGTCLVKRWQVVYTADWEPDDGLDVWIGE